MNRVLFEVGPVKIYYYSLTILIAILTAIFISIKRSKKAGMSSTIENLIFSTIISGIIGARLYYIIFNFSQYKNDLLSIFKIWEGGIAIYGGIIGGLIAIIYKCKKNNIDILRTTDIIVPGLILAQAIGRWGNFFNSEAYGKDVSIEFLKQIHIPNFIINGMYIEGAYHHPTFLYESIWCILGFIIIIIITKIIKDKKGLATYIYLIWYGVGRYLIEGLRTDLGSYGVYTEVIVPEGYVFVMGDNRGHSTDSRCFGCIPVSKIEGKVWIRFWPFTKFGKVE